MKHFRSMTALLLIAVMLFSLTACGQKAESDPPQSTGNTPSAPVEPSDADPSTTQQPSDTDPSIPEQSEPRIVTDMNGDTVEIAPGDVKIMTCAAVNTMAVLMLGGTDAVATLGLGFEYSEGSLNRSMFPGLDSLPTTTRENANAEEVASIAPSVVLVDVPDIISTLRGIGIPTAYLTVISPETLIQAVKLVGDIIGGEAVDKAAAFGAYYQDLIDSTTALTKDLTEDERPLVYYGRIEGGTAGRNSIPDFWIQASGGVNLASKLGQEGSRASVSDEELFANDPDIIITETPELAEIFRTSEKYAALSAVANGRVYCNPAGWGMGSMESALQLVWAPSIIQPELFADNDTEAATREYYQNFYGYTLSDSELSAIVYPDR